MNSLEANTRNTKSKGDVNNLRFSGNVPAIIYGGSNQNEKISIFPLFLKISWSWMLTSLLRKSPFWPAGPALTEVKMD